MKKYFSNDNFNSFRYSILTFLISRDIHNLFPDKKLWNVLNTLIIFNILSPKIYFSNHKYNFIRNLKSLKNFFEMSNLNCLLVKKHRSKTKAPEANYSRVVWKLIEKG